MRTLVITIVLLLTCLAWAQKPAPQQPATPPDPSGMYSFLKEGEFVEVDIDANRVSGFISRYADSDSDRGAFLDYMFTRGSYEGHKLAFATRTVHQISYEFQGTLAQDASKAPGSEGYYVIKGTLTENTISADGKTSARRREVEFKSFPADAQAPK